MSTNVFSLHTGLFLGMSNNCCHNWFHLGDKHAKWRRFYFDLSLVGSQEWRVSFIYHPNRKYKSHDSYFSYIYCIKFCTDSNNIDIFVIYANGVMATILFVFLKTDKYIKIVLQNVIFADQPRTVPSSVHQHIHRPGSLKCRTTVAIFTNSQGTNSNRLSTFCISFVCCLLLSCRFHPPTLPHHFPWWPTSSRARSSLDATYLSWSSYSGRPITKEHLCKQEFKYFWEGSWIYLVSLFYVSETNSFRRCLSNLDQQSLIEYFLITFH